MFFKRKINYKENMEIALQAIRISEMLKNEISSLNT